MIRLTYSPVQLFVSQQSVKWPFIIYSVLGTELHTFPQRFYKAGAPPNSWGPGWASRCAPWGRDLALPSWCPAIPVPTAVLEPNAHSTHLLSENGMTTRTLHTLDRRECGVGPCVRTDEARSLLLEFTMKRRNTSTTECNKDKKNALKGVLTLKYGDQRNQGKKAGNLEVPLGSTGGWTGF